MMERLQKIISRHGLASRRQAEAMLVDGRVTVNGVLASLGDSADENTDCIAVDGICLVAPPKRICLMLNKPRGYVTTLSDERGRKTVADLVADCGQRVYPVGRLDLSSEGLLLLTNDGELANKLTYPKGEVKKVYHVWLRGFGSDSLELLQRSIMIDGRNSIPARVKVLSQDNGTTLTEFTLFEGRNRQIRRLCEAAGITVTRLKRVQEGALKLGDLSVGKWRLLTDDELAGLTNDND